MPNVLRHAPTALRQVGKVLNDRWVTLNIDTNGLDPKVHEVIKIQWTGSKDYRIATTYINVSNVGRSDIHGITEEWLKRRNPVDAVTAFKKTYDRISEIERSGRSIIVFGTFPLRFIQAGLVRHLGRSLDEFVLDVIDLRVLDRLQDPKRTGPRSLDNCLLSRGIPFAEWDRPMKLADLAQKIFELSPPLHDMHRDKRMQLQQQWHIHNECAYNGLHRVDPKAWANDFPWPY